MLDESGGHELTVEQRRAAERAMDARDRKRGRSPSLPPLESPGRGLASSPTPGRKSRRLATSPGGSDSGDGDESELMEADVGEEEPVAQYDLSHEQLGE